MAETYKAKNIRQLYTLNPLKCKECKSVIPYEKRKKQGKFKFCCNECSLKYYTKVGRVITLEGKRRMSELSSKQQKEMWTEERRKQHSQLMKKIVERNPESYSNNNVCGRVKSIPIIDSYGNKTKCLGKWELLVAEYLNQHNIKWTNKISEHFEYEWNGSTHRYFPDFKLPEKNMYIEVKGYERERDRKKWNQFPYPLIIIKLDDIKKIKSGHFSLDNFSI